MAELEVKTELIAVPEDSAAPSPPSCCKPKEPRKKLPIHSDGYAWVKYGEKFLSPSGIVREYYKCRNWKPQHGGGTGCQAKKVVDRPYSALMEDLMSRKGHAGAMPSEGVTSYGLTSKDPKDPLCSTAEHNHPPPQQRSPRNSLISPRKPKASPKGAGTPTPLGANQNSVWGLVSPRYTQAVPELTFEWVSGPMQKLQKLGEGSVGTVDASSPACQPLYGSVAASEPRRKSGSKASTPKLPPLCPATPAAHVGISHAAISLQTPSGESEDFAERSVVGDVAAGSEGFTLCQTSIDEHSEVPKEQPDSQAGYLAGALAPCDDLAPSAGHASELRGPGRRLLPTLSIPDPAGEEPGGWMEEDGMPLAYHVEESPLEVGEGGLQEDFSALLSDSLEDPTDDQGRLWLAAGTAQLAALDLSPAGAGADDRGHEDGGAMPQLRRLDTAASCSPGTQLQPEDPMHITDCPSGQPGTSGCSVPPAVAVLVPVLKEQLKNGVLDPSTLQQILHAIKSRATPIPEEGVGGTPATPVSGTTPATPGSAGTPMAASGSASGSHTSAASATASVMAGPSAGGRPTGGQGEASTSEVSSEPSDAMPLPLLSALAGSPTHASSRTVGGSVASREVLLKLLPALASMTQGQVPSAGAPGSGAGTPSWRSSQHQPQTGSPSWPYPGTPTCSMAVCPQGTCGVANELLMGVPAAGTSEGARAASQDLRRPGAQHLPQTAAAGTPEAHPMLHSPRRPCSTPVTPSEAALLSLACAQRSCRSGAQTAGATSTGVAGSPGGVCSPEAGALLPLLLALRAGLHNPSEVDGAVAGSALQLLLPLLLRLLSGSGHASSQSLPHTPPGMTGAPVPTAVLLHLLHSLHLQQPAPTVHKLPASQRRAVTGAPLGHSGSAVAGRSPSAPTLQNPLAVLGQPLPAPQHQPGMHGHAALPCPEALMGSQAGGVTSPRDRAAMEASPGHRGGAEAGDAHSDPHAILKGLPESTLRSVLAVLNQRLATSRGPEAPLETQPTSPSAGDALGTCTPGALVRNSQGSPKPLAFCEPSSPSAPLALTGGSGHEPREKDADEAHIQMSWEEQGGAGAEAQHVTTPMPQLRTQYSVPTPVLSSRLPEHPEPVPPLSLPQAVSHFQGGQGVVHDLQSVQPHVAAGARAQLSGGQQLSTGGPRSPKTGGAPEDTPLGGPGLPTSAMSAQGGAESHKAVQGVADTVADIKLAASIRAAAAEILIKHVLHGRS